MVDILDALSVLVLGVIPFLTGLIAGVFRQLPRRNNETRQIGNLQAMFEQGLRLAVLPVIVLFVSLSVIVPVFSVIVGSGGGRHPVSLVILRGIEIVPVIGVSVVVFTITGAVLGVLLRH